MFKLGKSSPHWNDSPLVRRALADDGHAWAEIVERYSAYVYGLLRSTGLPESEQPDAFQYVFIELFKALPTLKNTDVLAPWIRQTTIRKAIRLRNETAKLTELEDAETIADVSQSEEIEAREVQLLVRDAVLSLKEHCQRLIQALFFEEEPRSYAEISAELGLREGSMGNTRLRCLDALSKALKARGVI